MAQNHPIGEVDLPIALRIEQVCNMFEAAWQNGTPPVVEDLLVGWEDPHRSELLQELVCLDIHYRRRKGEACTLDLYLRRFPHLDSDSFHAILAESSTTTVDTVRVTSSTTDSLPNVGGHEILGEIARGGMGVVYRARQRGLNRQVALKMILPGQLVTAEAVDRFRTEAENVARLQHANIVPIYEVGEFQGQPYFSMKLIEGASLDRRIAEMVENPVGSARLMATVALAVHHAHQHALIHRDLKPSNILVDPEGEPHVTDFGLAKRLEASIDLTRSNAIVGTPCYMAPEQAAGQQQRISTATDVYGLGAILYELLTGRPPFKAETPLDTLMLVLHEEPTPPRQIRKSVPRDLEVICLKCLQKEPKNRYRSALELAEDLQRWLDGEPINARAVTMLERAVRWIRRHPAPTALIVVSFLGALSLVGVLVAQSYNAKLALVNDKLSDTNGKLEVALNTAQREKEEADRQRIKARESEKTTRRFMYVTRMTQAEQARKEGKIGRMLQLLRSVIPESPEQEDLRGWEWHRMWRMHQGEKSRLRGHVGPVLGVVFSRDDKHLASCGEDGTVRLWNAVTGKSEHVMKGHVGRVNSIAFSRDSKRLVSGGDDHTIRIWDTATGKQVQVIAGHTERVTAVVFCPKTGNVISGSYDKSVRVWDREGKTKLNFQGHKEPVQSVTVSPDGAQIVSCSQGTTGLALGKGVLCVWDVQREGILKESNVQAGSVVFSEDGKLLAICETFRPKDGLNNALIHTLQFYSTATWEPLNKLEHPAQLTQGVFSLDGKKIITGSHDQKLRVWDIEKGAATDGFHEDGPVLAVGISPDGKRFASGSEDGVVKIWSSPDPEARIIRRNVGGLAFSPDGSEIVATDATYSSRSNPQTSSQLYNVFTLQKMKDLSGMGGCRPSWSSDGKLLFGSPGVWDRQSGKKVVSLAETNFSFVAGIVSFDRGKRIVGGKGHGGNKAIMIWDAKSGRVLQSYPFDPWISGLAVSPDDQWLVVGGSKTGSPGNRTLWAEWMAVWDLRTGAKVRSFDGILNCVWRVRFSPDGRYLAAAIGEHWGGKMPGEVRVYRTGTWELVWRLQGHSSIVYSVAFSPCSRRLVSVSGKSAPSEVRLWDMQTGQEVWNMPVGKIGQPYDVEFSPCGRRLAVGAGSLMIFDGTPLAESPTYTPAPE